ncbi:MULTISPECIES: O-antigen translocase [Enterobacter]|uniref:O-antigen translocase n=1 Tax=Enterobacter TaxID=547 RepID=UPI00135B04A5|nr:MULTISPECIES: O-antigen translocase [Enterobacter]
MANLNFAKVTIFSGILTLLRLLCGFAISKVVAIYTGPVGIAGLGQLQNLVTFINGFVSSQVSQGINRYSAENKNDYESAKYYWRAALKLSVVACLFIICLGCILSSNISMLLFSTKAYYWIVILALIVVPLNVINNIFLGVLNGLGDHYRFFVANGCAVVFSAISMMLLVYLFGLKGALIAAALNNAIAGLWLVFVVMKCDWFKYHFWVGKTTSSHISEMRNYFFMGIIGALTGPVSLILVRTILTKDFSAEYAGYWQSVSKLSEAYLAVLTTALTVYYFPKTAAAKTVKEHISVLKTGCLIVIPFACMFAMSIFWGKEYILKILFSSEFIAAKQLFLFQNLGDVFRITSWLFATVLLAKGYFKINAILEITFSILFPLLTWGLTKYFSFTGVSIAYCITYLGYLIVSILIYIAHIKRLQKVSDIA